VKDNNIENAKTALAHALGKPPEYTSASAMVAVGYALVSIAESLSQLVEQGFIEKVDGESDEGALHG